MISCMIHIRASSSRNGGRGHRASGTLHIAQCILHCIDAILPRKELEEREGGGGVERRITMKSLVFTNVSLLSISE